MLHFVYWNLELFLFILLLLCGGAAAALDQSTLSVLFALCGAVYIPLLLIARKIGSISFKYFIYLMVGLRLISLPILDLNQNSYEHSGWSAVKDFDFSSLAYLNLLLFDAAALYLISVNFCLIWLIFKKGFRGLPICRFKFQKLKWFRDGGVFGGAIIISIVPFVLVNYYVFLFANENKIGIPGIQPNMLPYSLAGVTYYYQKFFGPVFLYLIVKNSKSSLLICILSLLLPIISLLTLSRSAVAFWCIPLMVVAYRNCQSKFVILFICSMVIVATLLAQSGRYLMFINDNGSLALDTSIRLAEIVMEAWTEFTFSDIFVAIGELISRVGGGQEIVLGYQATLPSFDYALQLLFQTFTGLSTEIDYASLVQITHDFIPLEGSVALLSYSGFMLAFLNTNLIIFFVFSFVSSVFILLNQYIREVMLRYSVGIGLSNFVCFFLTFIFFGMIMVRWYFGFIFVLCMAFVFAHGFFDKEAFALKRLNR